MNTNDIKATQPSGKHNDTDKEKQPDTSTTQPTREAESTENDFADIAHQDTFFAENALLTHPSYKKLEENLNAAEAQAQENFDKLMRKMAELDNFRRRSERDVDSARKYAIQRLIEELLPIIDSLERAMQLQIPKEGAEAIRSMQQGIELTLKLFADTLQKFSVQAIDPLGQPFDPSVHEAISIQESATVEPGTILNVLQKGYLLHDRSIRPARVIVAKAPAAKEDKETAEDEWMD